MHGRLLVLIGCVLVLGVDLVNAQTEAKFKYTPGEELTYKVEVKNQMRVPKGLPNWSGEMKVWPIERRPDGAMVLRARGELKVSYPNDPKIKGGGTIAEWAEINIDAQGKVAPYHFLPQSGVTPAMPFAFPVPDVKASGLSWSAPGPENAVFEYSLAPGTSFANSPWQINVVDHWPRLKAQGIHRQEQISCDPGAGRVIAWHALIEYETGALASRELSATFESARQLSPAEFAQVKHDSGVLLDAATELDQLISTAPDTAEEFGPYKQRVEKLKQALVGIPQSVQEVAFKDDLKRYPMSLISGMIDSAQEHIDTIAKQKAQLIDKVSPDWTAQDISGQAHSLKDYRGKIVLLDFWNRQCGPCLISMPFVKKMEEDYKGQPFIVIGLDKFDSPEVFRKTTQFLHLENPQFLAGTIPELYDVAGNPVYVLIDEQGVIRFKHTGWDDGVDKTLRTQIDGLLAKMTPGVK